MSNTETVRLGDEDDDALRKALARVLAEMSAHEEAAEWALAGSQELESVRVLINGEPICIESETYMGLTITGESLLVQELARRVAERMQT